MGTSDAERACTNAYRIFPDLTDLIPLKDTDCVSLCKLELPGTCFQLVHADSKLLGDGLLPIGELEAAIDAKWTHAIESHTYDAMFDYNMAFWARDLDELITLWRTESPDLEWIGVEWVLPLDFKKEIDDPAARGEGEDPTPFYSLIVHSPHSQIHYEFMSFTKPDLYDTVDWIEDSVARTTFGILHQSGDYKGRFNGGVTRYYPFNRPDKVGIVPVRISRATSNLSAVTHFYENVLGADVYGFDVDAASDSTKPTSAFIRLPGTQIETQFVQRPESATFGHLSVRAYEGRLRDTHAQSVSGPFCGEDRWMDNNIGYSSWELAGGLDKVYAQLADYDFEEVTFRVNKFPVAHALDSTKAMLHAMGYGGTFMIGMSVVDPTGHSNHIQGTLEDQELVTRATLYSQRCPTECEEGEEREMSVVVEGLMGRYEMHVRQWVVGGVSLLSVMVLWMVWRCVQIGSKEKYTVIE